MAIDNTGRFQVVDFLADELGFDIEYMRIGDRHVYYANLEKGNLEVISRKPVYRGGRVHSTVAPYTRRVGVIVSEYLTGFAVLDMQPPYTLATTPIMHDPLEFMLAFQDMIAYQQERYAIIMQKGIVEAP